MLEAKSLISKQVVFLGSGKMLGYVVNFQIENSSLKYIYVVNDNDDEILKVPTKNIFACQNQIITLKSENEITKSALPQKVLGSNVLQQDGKVIDVLIDVLVDEKTFKVKEFVCQKQKILPEKIKSISSGFIFLKGNAKITKTKKVLPPLPTVSENLNIVQKREEKQISSPKKVVGSYGFLIGRKLSADLKNTQGKIIIAKGTILSKSTIDRAISLGQINFLLSNSMINF